MYPSSGLLAFLAISSIIVMEGSGLGIPPCLSPLCAVKLSVYPSSVLTILLLLSYMLLTALCSSLLLLFKDFHIQCRGSVSKAFSRSIALKIFPLPLIILFEIGRKHKIQTRVPLPALKPAWFP